MKISLLLLCIIACVSCRQHRSYFHDDEKKRLVADVKVMMGAYHADVRNEGLLGEFKYLDSSADFFWVPPGYHTAISYDSVAAVLKSSAGRFKKIDNNWDTLHIVPVTKEIASYTGRLRSAITDTSGNTTSMVLLETGIVIKRSDGWKLLSGQTSVLQ